MLKSKILYYSAAATEVAYVLYVLLWELKFPLRVYYDNQSAQYLVRNPIYHWRHVGDMCSKSEVDIIYMPTDDMMYCILTKNLWKLKRNKFTSDKF